MKALIVGWGISGKGSALLLEKQGWQVEVYDDRKADCAPYRQVERDDMLEAVRDKDLVVVSPAVSLDHPVIGYARACAVEVIGELELAYRNRRGDLIAVTGTNGKTTTTLMICSMLKAAGMDARALGNIGRSWASELADGNMDENSVAVVEVSSFQLESATSFAPKYAVCLNVSPDHYERHGNFECYAQVKRKIFQYQSERDYAVLNYDDSTVRGFCDSIGGRVFWFSLNHRVKGAYCAQGKIWFDDGSGREEVCSVGDVGAQGEYNLSNALACVAVGKLIGVDNLTIKKSLSAFRPPLYRRQLIATIGGKRYYNDSKATNIDSTLKACAAMQGDTALIAGGYDKGISYAGFFQMLPSNVKHIVACGDNVYEMMQFLPAYHDFTYEITSTLERAVKIASEKDVENVLFSPTTSSFDRYSGYVERGKHFDAVVKELGDEEKADLQ